jgi:hypothetical protein
VPILIVHGLLLVCVGIMISPMLIAPALASTSMTVFVSHPTAYRPIAAIIVHVCALVLPVVLELTHALPSVLTFGDTGLWIRPWFADISGGTLLALCTVGVTTQVVAAWAVVSRLRKEQEAAQLRVALHLWQLEKLLPNRREDP